MMKQKICKKRQKPVYFKLGLLSLSICSALQVASAKDIEPTTTSNNFIVIENAVVTQGDSVVKGKTIVPSDNIYGSKLITGQKAENNKLTINNANLKMNNIKFLGDVGAINNTITINDALKIENFEYDPILTWRRISLASIKGSSVTSGNTEGNQVTILSTKGKKSPDIKSHIMGGYTENGDATRNQVNISDVTDLLVQVEGGATSKGNANNNTVTLNNISKIYDTNDYYGNKIYGGATSKGNAEDNKVTITSTGNQQTTKIIASIVGGNASNGNANGNQVEISEATDLEAWVRGGGAYEGNANNNTVILKNISKLDTIVDAIGFIEGGKTEISGNAEGNEVIISSVKELNVPVFGGYIDGKGNANHNKVNLFDVKKLAGVAGGYSFYGEANSNTVSLVNSNVRAKDIYNTDLSIDISGGASKNKSIDNVINIAGDSDLSIASLFGGRIGNTDRREPTDPITEDIFDNTIKGNTLNIGLHPDGRPMALKRSSGEVNTVKLIDYFENIAFHGVEWDDAKPALKILEATNLERTKILANNIHFTNLTELLESGKKMTLLDTNGHNAKIQKNNVISGNYKVGTTLEGNGRAELEGYNVVYITEKTASSAGSTPTPPATGTPTPPATGTPTPPATGTPTPPATGTPTPPATGTPTPPATGTPTPPATGTPTPPATGTPTPPATGTPTPPATGTPTPPATGTPTPPATGTPTPPATGTPTPPATGTPTPPATGTPTPPATGTPTPPATGTPTPPATGTPTPPATGTPTPPATGTPTPPATSTPTPPATSTPTPPVLQVRDQTHNVVIGKAGELSTIISGNDYVAGVLDSLTDSSGNGVLVAVTGSGSSQKYKTGSHVKTALWNGSVGVGYKAALANGDMSYMLFYEYGKGDYDVVSESGEGSGDIKYHGGAFGAKYKHNNNVYVDASLRLGNIKNTANNVLTDGAGKGYSYKTNGHYFGGHIGVGKIVNLTQTANVDIYGKYFYTNIEKDNFEAGGKYKLDAVDSNIAKIGARMNHGINKWHLYYGVAYEYEFSGEAKGTADGLTIRSADISGSSIIGELGVKLKPSKESAWELDLGVNGYAGKHQGYKAKATLGYKF